MKIRLTQPQVELEAWAELGNMIIGRGARQDAIRPELAENTYVFVTLE